MHLIFRMELALKRWEEQQALLEEPEYDTTVVVATGVTRADYDRFMGAYTGKIRSVVIYLHVCALVSICVDIHITYDRYEYANGCIVVYGGPSPRHVHASRVAARRVTNALNSLAGSIQFEHGSNWGIGNDRYKKAIDEGIVFKDLFMLTPLIAIEVSYANESLIKLTEIVNKLVTSNLGISLAVAVKIFGHRPGTARRIVVLAATESSPDVIYYDTFHGGHEVIGIPAESFQLSGYTEPNILINFKDIALAVAEMMRQGDEVLDK